MSFCIKKNTWLRLCCEIHKTFYGKGKLILIKWHQTQIYIRSISIQSTNLLFSLRSHSPSGINQSYFLHPQFLLLNWNGSILIHSPYLTVFLLHNKHFSKPTFPTSCCQPHSNSTVFINQRTSDTEFKGWPQGSWNSYCINIMFTGGQAFSSGLLSIKVLGGVKYTTLSPLVNGTEEQKL